MKGTWVWAPVPGNTPRIGAKRQTGCSGNLTEYYEQVGDTINEESYNIMGRIHV